MHLDPIENQIIASESKISSKNPPTSMATPSTEILPPPLDATGEQPPLFDGTTRLYTCYTCPFAQRVWITRNYKGLQEKIKLVPLNLQNIPAWYKDVYPPNKVPSLEHNGKIIGESLDLIKYVDSNFEGPLLLPDDPEKKKFGEELLSYTDTFFGTVKKLCGKLLSYIDPFVGTVFTSFEGPSLFPDDPEKKKFGEELLSYTDTFVRTVFTSFEGDPEKETVPVFDHLEDALHKFDDGLFFLGQFSLVDIAYIPFVERFQIFLTEAFQYDITAGRPKLAAWIEELNKIDAYTQTKTDPKELVEFYKTRFLAQQ